MKGRLSHAQLAIPYTHRQISTPPNKRKYFVAQATIFSAASHRSVAPQLPYGRIWPACRAGYVMHVEPLRHWHSHQNRASSARDVCLTPLQQHERGRIQAVEATSLHEQQRQPAVSGGCCRKIVPPSRVCRRPTDATPRSTPAGPASNPRHLEGHQETATPCTPRP